MSSLSDADREELDEVLGFLQTQLETVDSLVNDSLMTVRRKQSEVRNGHDLLQVKMALFAQYCASIAFFVRLKLEMKSAVDHKVRDALIEDRLFLEKISILEKRNRGSMERLLRLASNAEKGSSSVLRHRPHPEDLEDKSEVSKEGTSENDANVVPVSDKYVPPKIDSVVLEDDKASKRARRQRVHDLQKLARSDLVRDLQEELGDKPREVTIHGDLGKGSSEKRIEDDRRRLKEYEESTFTRVLLSKKDRNRLNAPTRGDTLQGIDGASNDLRALQRLADSSSRRRGDEGRGRPPHKRRKRGR